MNETINMANYYNLLLRNLEQQDSAALTFGENTKLQIGYKGLLKKVNAYRSQLRNCRLESTTAVIIGIPMSIDTFAAFLAVIAEGHSATFLPKSNKVYALRSIEKHGFLKTILLPSKTTWLKQTLFRILGIKIIPEGTSVEISNDSIASPTNDTALISFSSGSTGKPKPILRKHRTLINQHLAISAIYPRIKDQVDLPLFPNLILHNLALGINSVLPDIQNFDLKKLEPQKIIAQINKHGVNSLTGNVFYFKKVIAFCKEHKIKLDKIEAVGIGGSPVPEYLLVELKALFPNSEIYVIYGSTEAEPISHRTFSDTYDPLLGYPVGEFHEDISYKIENPQTIVISRNTEVLCGEICVKGPHVISSGADDWLRTGDFGYVQDSQLYLTGRKGNEKAWGGFQHYQLEHYLSNHEKIESAAAISEKDGFTIHFSGSLDEVSLRDVLKEVIAPKWIKKIVHKNALPFDDRHHSKIIYSKLQA